MAFLELSERITKQPSNSTKDRFCLWNMVSRISMTPPAHRPKMSRKSFIFINHAVWSAVPIYSLSVEAVTRFWKLPSHILKSWGHHKQRTAPGWSGDAVTKNQSSNSWALLNPLHLPPFLFLAATVAKNPSQKPPCLVSKPSCIGTTWGNSDGIPDSALCAAQGRSVYSVSFSCDKP